MINNTHVYWRDLKGDKRLDAIAGRIGARISWVHRDKTACEICPTCQELMNPECDCDPKEKENEDTSSHT